MGTYSSGACKGFQNMSDGKVNISYSTWGTEEGIAEIRRVADSFNHQQDKIQVTVIHFPYERYIEELNTMAAANRLPDCGLMSEAAVLQYAAKGYLADISNMYLGSESRLLANLAFKDPDNKTVAFSVANQILLLYYNKNMFDKAGAPYPPARVEDAWTWAQFIEAARRLTFDRNGRTPNDADFDRSSIVQYGAMVENLTWQLEVWCLSNGGGFYSPEGSQVIIDQDPAIEAIQRVADLHLVHNVAPLSSGLTDDGIQRSIITGSTAMATGGQWNMGTCLSTARKEKGLNYGVAVLPYMKEKVTLNTGGPNVVFSQSKNPKEAFEFIKWFSAEENYWSMIEYCFWMLPQEKWYTSEISINDCMDYAVKAAKPASWYYVNNTVDFNKLLASILGDVWTGRMTAKEAITANAAALRRAQAGK